jgi:hypothetical protein
MRLGLILGTIALGLGTLLVWSGTVTDVRRYLRIRRM